MLWWIFPTLLILAVAFVTWFGGHEERLALAVLVSAYLVTFAVMRFDGEGNWLDPPVWIGIADFSAFAVLAALAIRSNRFWPLPLAALHLLPALTPVLAQLGQGLVSHAIGVSQGIWSYFQLAILIFATARHRRRMRRLSATPTF
jgi:hypothetical protein